jgi:outer membrane protein
MRQFHGFGVVFLLFISAALTWGAESENPQTPLLESAAPLSPDELYQIALLNNPDHQKAVANAELSVIGMRSAWGTLLPSVNVGYQISQNEYYQSTYTNPDGSVSSYPYSVWTYVPKVLTDADSGFNYVGWDPDDSVMVTYEVPEGRSRTSSGWLSVQETIRLGGQQYYLIQNARVNSRMNDLQVKSSETGLLFAVRQNSYNVLANQRLLDLARKVLEQRQEQLRLAKARYEIGSVTELDVMQAEIDVGNQENVIIAAENSLKVARDELNGTLGVDLNSNYELKDDYRIFEPQYTLPDLLARAAVSRPDYLLANQQEEYQKNLARSRRGEFFPDLTASLTHSRSQSSGGNVDYTLNPRNRNTSISLGLSWNLFSGFADQAQYEQSRVELRNSRFDTKKQEQTIEKEVRQAYYALLQTYEQSKITEKNRELASRQLQLEQERYRLGATSQLNLRVAQVTFEQAEGDHIAKIFNFWSSLAALEQAVGQRLP